MFFPLVYLRPIFVQTKFADKSDSSELQGRDLLLWLTLSYRREDCYPLLSEFSVVADRFLRFGVDSVLNSCSSINLFLRQRIPSILLHQYLPTPCRIPEHHLSFLNRYIMLQLMFQDIVNQLLKRYLIIKAFVCKKHKVFNRFHWYLTFGREKVVVFSGDFYVSFTNFMCEWLHIIR